jgi:hypothetical protein
MSEQNTQVAFEERRERATSDWGARRWRQAGLLIGRGRGSSGLVLASRSKGPSGVLLAQK